jgi:3-methyl-2-oxobutanoate hydroxymethyltransferase
MPFLTYQCGEDKAVEYAGKIIQSTYAKAVKVEGAEPEIQKVISRLIRMGIPVMGHIGLTPQSYLNIGLKKQGESLASQEKIKKEALILEQLGCFSIVLEHIPDLLAKEIQNSLTIPTIGIGAGNYCDGQVRVTADLLGLNDDQPPFCQPIIQGKKLFKDKLKEWVDSERLS